MKFRILQIAKKIFFSQANKNLDLVTKLYLTQTYLKNLSYIKRKNNLNLFNKILCSCFNSIYINRQKILLNELESKLQNLDAVLKQKNFCESKKFPEFPDFQSELNEIKQKIRKEKIEKIKITFLYYLNKINIKHLLDLKNSQNNLKNIFNFLSRNIEIYKRSIQELVEGQREVTQNKKFQFEDGETVQDKMDKFETKLKENLHSGKSIKDSIKNKNKLI